MCLSGLSKDRKCVQAFICESKVPGQASCQEERQSNAGEPPALTSIFGVYPDLLVVHNLECSKKSARWHGQIFFSIATLETSRVYTVFDSHLFWQLACHGVVSDNTILIDVVAVWTFPCRLKKRSASSHLARS